MNMLSIKIKSISSFLKEGDVKSSATKVDSIRNKFYK